MADENFNADLVRGVLDRVAGWDLTTVEAEGMRTAPDPDVLEFAASQGRVLLTHDEETMPKFAYERLVEGSPMPGVVVVPWTMPLGQAVEGITLRVIAGVPADFDGLVTYL